MRLVIFSLFMSLASMAAVPETKLELVAQGFSQPVDLVFDPSRENRFYVVEQRGRIMVSENGKIFPEPLLSIEGGVTSGGEMGLLSLAFHPNFILNQRYFVNYTKNEGGSLRSYISEFQMGSPKEKVLLDFYQPYSNHNGGQLVFDKAGYLYIGTGDGGSGGDPQDNGQSKKTLLGKILRIDVDKGTPYAIPTDNPFQGPGEKKEIYAYGLRNPWRFSFDKLTGLLYVGDVGQDKYEEVDIVEKGGNYGWNTMEGTHCFEPSVGCNQNGLTLPIQEYPHSQGNSITGGFVYRGNTIAALQGYYIYGDYGSGKIWALKYDERSRKRVSNELLLNSHLPISAFGQDSQGEVYVVSYQGKIYRIAPKS